MDIERLQVVFEAETSRYAKGIQDVKKQTEQIEKTIADKMEPIKRSVKNTADSLNASFKTGLQKVNNTVKAETAKLQDRFSSTMNNVKNIIASALAAIGAMKLGSSLINLASNLEETQNVVDVAFGEMADKANAFGIAALKTYGMSEQAAKQVASTHMAMAKGMDVPIAKAADMSLAITGLSADMASFFNTTTSVTDTALRSIWTGETETLKKYGVVMTQANLQQYAMNQGLQVNISELDQASAAALRYAYVMDTLSYVHGDFSRNANSWANQTRVLSEQFKQLGTIVGGWLVKAFTPVVQMLNVMLGKALQFAQVLNTIFGKMFNWETPSSGGGGMTDAVSLNDQVAASTDKVAAANDNAKKASDKAGEAAKKAAAKAKGALASFDKLNILQKPQDSADSGSSTTPGTGDIGDVGSLLGDLGSPNFDILSNLDTDTSASKIQDMTDKIEREIQRLKTILQPLFNADFGPLSASVARLGDAFRNLVSISWESFLRILDEALVPMGVWFIEKGLPGLVDLLATAFGHLARFIESTTEPAIIFINGVLQPLADFFISKGLPALVDGLGVVLDGVAAAFGRLAPVAADFVQNALIPLGDWFATSVIPTVAQGISDTLVFLSDTIAELSEPVTTFLNEALIPFADTLVSKGIPALVTAIQDVLSKLSETVQGIIPHLQNFVNDVLTPLANWFIEKGVPALVDLLSGAFEGLQGIIEGVAPILLSFWTDILQPVGEFTGEIVIATLGTLSDLLSNFGDWCSNNSDTIKAAGIAVGSFFAAWQITKALSFVGQMGGITAAFAALATGIWATVTAKVADKAQTIALTALYAKDAIVKGASTVKEIAHTVAVGAGTVAKGLATAATWAFNAAMAVLTSPITWVIAAIAGVIAIIVILVKNWDKVKEVASAVWTTIKAVWGAVATWFNTTIVQPISIFFSSMWNNLKTGASNAWSGIKSVFSSVANWFKDIFSKAWTNVKNVFSTGGKVFTGIKDGIVSVFKTVVNAIIGGINTVIAVPFNAINGLLNKIRLITIVGFKPFEGMIQYNALSVPQIPKLDVGTNYVQRSGLAMIHEGEAVVPKKYNPALSGAESKEQVSLLKEQNYILKELLNKDSNVYLDDREVSSRQERNARRARLALGRA